MKHFSIRIGLSTLTMLLLVGLLFGLDWLCYQQTLPITVILQNGVGTLHVGTTTLKLGSLSQVTDLKLPVTDPVIHEYQLDGTDSTNNLTLDTTYLHNIESSLYYRFVAWMRNLDGTSHWRDIRVQENGQLVRAVDWPADGQQIHLPTTRTSAPLTIQLGLQRPETPRTFTLSTGPASELSIILNRNERFIQVVSSSPEKGVQEIARAFFPTDELPILAMVLDTVIRSLLCALAVVMAVLVGETIIASIGLLLRHLLAPMPSSEEQPNKTVSPIHEQEEEKKKEIQQRPVRFLAIIWHNLTNALHPVALLALGVSFGFVLWIARVQYNGQPHIYDAVAYLFAAKTYASGQVAAPAPALSTAFPGPFMVINDGKWFAQYPPGTSLTLVPGVWLGVPWLVEPLLGTLALLGIGLIVARLYNRMVATLTVLLGTLSPFYSYLAASYLSHTIALFYLVWGTFFLLTFLSKDGRGGGRLLLAAVCFGMAILTRDLVGGLYTALLLCGLALRYWRQIYRRWYSWRGMMVLALLILLAFEIFQLTVNTILTGQPLLSPRTLFYPADRWGFGSDIGFYGEHTLAAGLMNLDQQLTILAIDLYGWPFYFTFAFLALPFLLRRANALDWFCLLGFCLVACLFVGYFYHGIYLGPRYLFETLPFLLILTARGILLAGAYGAQVRRVACGLAGWMLQMQVYRKDIEDQEQRENWRGRGSAVVVVIVCLLIACNLLYFLPRQATLYTNYSGLPLGYRLDLATLYHPSLHNALVITEDQAIYQMVLFPLNDPRLQGDIVYALGSTPQDYEKLRKAFPGRRVYHLTIGLDGSIGYQPVGSITELQPSFSKHPGAYQYLNSNEEHVILVWK
jgi:hypothetical protein